MKPLAFLTRLATAFGLLLVTALAGAAQSTVSPDSAPVALVADSIIVERDEVLIAEGAVEVFSAGRHLRATRIVYDRANDHLSIEGPIRLSEGPDTVILADAAELSGDLREGLITSARLILAQRLQIAAGQMQRQQGRFTDMRNTVASSCEVCFPGQAPLWEIRARRIIHDEVRQRIYFQHAQFRIVGIPIFYLPAMSTPDPDVERARGFLVPSSSSSTLLGTGLKLPYFIPLGDHADLTLTPYASTDLSNAFTRTLEARYRQAFSNGEIQFTGAISEDSVEPNMTRAYLFGNGVFDLPEQVKLRFGIQLVRDDNYLSDYDYSGADRLENTLSLTRIVGDTRAAGEVIAFKSLRSDEDNDTIPVLVGDARFDRRWQMPGVGGFVDFTVLGHGHQRPSTDNIDGRDSAHGRSQLRWSTTETVGAGLRLGADARVIGDVKHIVQDDRYETWQSDVTPGLALSASLPMRAAGKDGVAYLLEPVAELVWSDAYDIDAPNDDSTRPNFDAGNLMGFKRFPGLDRVEDGLRLNAALRWQRYDPDGWTLGLTAGRVVRSKASDLFSPGTGLDGVRSDWLAQIDVDLDMGLALRSLTLIDDGGDVTLNETRLSLNMGDLDLSTSYVWQIADSALDLDTDLSEVYFEAAYRFSDTWSAEMDLRRDFVTERTTRAGLGLSYTNECVKVDFSGARRFRNTETAEPTISYGVTVSLTGFGGGSGSRAGRCSG